MIEKVQGRNLHTHKRGKEGVFANEINIMQNEIEVLSAGANAIKPKSKEPSLILCMNQRLMKLFSTDCNKAGPAYEDFSPKDLFEQRGTIAKVLIPRFGRLPPSVFIALRTLSKLLFT